MQLNTIAAALGQSRGPTVQTQEKPSVLIVLGQLRGLVALAYERVDLLQERLDPLLNPNCPVVHNAKEPGPAQGSPTLLQLQDLGAGLAALVLRLEAILGRLEI